MPIKDAFLAGVLATIPEGDRGKAEAAIQALEEGGLRQSDYSKLAAEARAEKEKFDGLYTKNVEWLTANKAALDEAATLRTKLAELEANPTVVTKVEVPKDVVTDKTLRETLDTMERGAIGFINDLTDLKLQHYQQFGEVLDGAKLLADPNVQKIGVRGVYQAQFKEQLDKKASDAQAARDETLRKEGEARVRATLNQQLPFPVVGNEPSALDAIEAARTGKTPSFASVEDMAGELARLSAKRMGAPA